MYNDLANCIMKIYVATKFSVGLPFPIVAVSAAISHRYYGINDRYIDLMIMLSVTTVHVNTGVGFLRKMVLFGHSLVLCC